MDALYFSFREWKKNILFLWGKGAVLSDWYSSYHWMQHNCRLQLPERDRPSVGFTFHGSLHTLCFFKWKIVFCMMPTGGLIRESTQSWQSFLSAIRSIDHLHIIAKPWLSLVFYSLMLLKLNICRKQDRGYRRAINLVIEIWLGKCVWPLTFWFSVYLLNIFSYNSVAICFDSLIY